MQKIWGSGSNHSHWFNSVKCLCNKLEINWNKCWSAHTNKKKTRRKKNKTLVRWEQRAGKSDG